MKKNVLLIGLIIGSLLSINIFIMVDMIYNDNGNKSNDVVGYAAMILMFSLIFFGVRNYRDKQLGGYISFGSAFKTGAAITLVAASIYGNCVAVLLLPVRPGLH